MIRLVLSLLDITEITKNIKTVIPYNFKIINIFMMGVTFFNTMVFRPCLTNDGVCLTNDIT